MFFDSIKLNLHSKKPDEKSESPLPIITGSISIYNSSIRPALKKEEFKIPPPPNSNLFESLFFYYV